MKNEEILLNEIHQKLSEFVNELLKIEIKREEFIQLQSIIGMVHTLYYENRIPELFNLFQIVYSEYYSNYQFPIDTNQQWISLN